MRDAADRPATNPLVSVVIPVYNQGQYLATAIDSVLSQDYPHIELVVVNDGSTDDTAAVIDGYADRIRSLDQPNQGASHALNRGIETSAGSLVCWLSADDEFLPGKVGAQVEAFRNDPDLWLSCTGYDVVDATGDLVRRMRAPQWRHSDPFVAVVLGEPDQRLNCHGPSGRVRGDGLFRCDPPGRRRR